MFKLLVAATLTTGLIAFATTPASASIMSSVDADGQFKDTSVAGTFTDIFKFTLDGLSKVNATFSGTPGTLHITDFGIYDGGVEKTTFGQASFGDSVAGGTDSIILGKGSYTIDVSGSVVGGGSAKYNGNLNISAVPLPPALSLFGLSLLGLGAYGAVRKKTLPRQLASS